MITSIITFGAQTLTVTWNDGTLGGDAGGVAYLQALAAALEGDEVGLPAFAGTISDHLRAARSFCALCIVMSDTYPQFVVTGDEPAMQAIALPEGLIS
jgi:hypothetical protein